MSKTITAGGKTYKPEEFVCGWCNTPLVLDTYYTIEGKNVCQSCRNKERCASCGFLITETKYVTVDHLTYHPDCFRCSECFEELQKFHLEDGKLFCTACLGGSTRSVDPENSCGKCNLPLSGSILKALGKRYHEDCFVCHSCFGPFPDDEFVNIEGNPFCDKCVDNRSYLRSTAHIKATGNPAGGAGGAGGADRGVPGASSSSGPGTNAGYGSGAPGSGAGAGYGSGAPGSGAGYGSGAPGFGSGAGAGGYGADRGLPSGAGGSGAGGYGSGAPGSGSGASGSGHGSGAPGSGSGAGGYGSGAPGSGSGASGSGAPGSGSGGDGYGADRGLPSGAGGSGSGAGGHGSGAPGSGSGASGSGAPGSGAGYGSGAPGSGSGAGGNGSGAPGSGSSYGSGAPGSGSSGSSAPGAGAGGAGGASRGIGGDDEDAYLDASNLPPKGPSKFDQKKKIKYGGGIKEEKRQRDYKSKAALGFCSETEHLKDLESLGYKTISRKKGL